MPGETNGPASRTRVVMLGTGTPRPDPDRAGPATAIVVDRTPYLIDFGAGVIRRATAAFEKGVEAIGFGGVNIHAAFLTHLHSDHTIGYPDLIFTPWVMGRQQPLSVYGPKGLGAMTEHILAAWQVDIDGRTKGINRHNTTGYAVQAHEIVPGTVYRDRDTTVTAFPVRHEEMADSFGYRFETPDRTIVISGDTAPTQSLIDHSDDCDVLIHEAYSMESYRRVSPRSQEFRRRHHTSSVECWRPQPEPLRYPGSGNSRALRRSPRCCARSRHLLTRCPGLSCTSLAGAL
jgi:ribonuclease BN (tRNA processing enzyme)